MEKQRGHYLTTVEWFNLNWCIQPICKLFGYQVFLVGSSLYKRDFRDIDIRIIMDDYTGVLCNQYGRKVMAMFISEWLGNRTGLPIDLQFQTLDEASEFEGPRNSLGITI